MDKLQEFKTQFAESLKAFNDRMSYEELKVALTSIIEFVKKQKEMTATELQAMKVMMSSALEKIKADQSSEMEKMDKDVMAYCEKEMNSMIREHEAMMSAMDAKMDEIKPLEPVDTDLIAKQASDLAITAIIPKIPTYETFKDNLSKAGDLIVDTLSKQEGEEKLHIADIWKLQETLDELRQIRSRTLGGGGFSTIAMQQHFIDDETPTGDINGVNTDFVISLTPSPASSLKVFLDGQRMKLTTDYTFTNKTITFLTAPLTGSLITVDYRI